MNEAGGTTATVKPSLHLLRYLMKLHKFKESPITQKKPAISYELCRFTNSRVSESIRRNNSFVTLKLSEKF